MQLEIRRDDDLGMNLTVGTTATRLPVGGDARVIVQNLGPGVVYIDGDSGVTAASGLQLAVDGAYEFPADLNQAGGSLYIIATLASTDVRYMVIG